jgi:UDP-N-acetylglucosamine 2-epimerase (non-hydrolysing)/GDP/UDP-N,N'-diacetylbacillosamine 2-epimerase (hydrolysing)
MSHLHFAAAPEYAARILQMGENPDLVFTYGPPGLDYIVKTKLLDRREFEAAIGFSLGKTNLLITYHPVTMSREDPEYGIGQLIDAIDDMKDTKIIFTMPNADPNGRGITSTIKKYVDSAQGKAIFFESLGQLRYFSAISHVDLVLGNSSSGLNEVPYFNKPTVNIGFRQEGRIYPPSVIHCKEDAASIRSAIAKALASKANSGLSDVGKNKNVGSISAMIKNTLREIDLKDILIKRFHQGARANYE